MGQDSKTRLSDYIADEIRKLEEECDDTRAARNHWFAESTRLVKEGNALLAERDEARADAVKLADERDAALRAKDSCRDGWFECAGVIRKIADAVGIGSDDNVAMPLADNILGRIAEACVERDTLASKLAAAERERDAAVAECMRYAPFGGAPYVELAAERDALASKLASVAAQWPTLESAPTTFVAMERAVNEARADVARLTEEVDALSKSGDAAVASITQINRLIDGQRATPAPLTPERVPASVRGSLGGIWDDTASVGGNLWIDFSKSERAHFNRFVDGVLVACRSEVAANACRSDAPAADTMAGWRLPRVDLVDVWNSPGSDNARRLATFPDWSEMSEPRQSFISNVVDRAITRASRLASDSRAPATRLTQVDEDDWREVPADVHESGWQWRPVGDGAFAPPFGTVRKCGGCDCLVAGGPSTCRRCADDADVARREREGAGK